MSGNPYEAPAFDRQWAEADIKMMLVDGRRRLALMVGGEIMALMDPKKVQEQLRYFGK